MSKKDSLFQRRKSRVRSSIRRKAKGRIRLAVFRSNQHIYAQLIDDTKSVTLAQASTIVGDESKNMKCKSNIKAAKLVGSLIAKKAKDVGVKEVVFDRGAYLYHGRVKALAEAARENGLSF